MPVEPISFILRLLIYLTEAISLYNYHCPHAIRGLSSVQWLSRVRLFATPMTTACQGSMSIINAPELAQAHVHQVGDDIQPSHPLLSPSPPTFNLFQHQGLFQCQFFASGGLSIGASASASVLPMNIQDWDELILAESFC